MDEIMNPLLASDITLIEKLENIASITNEIVLSVEEISRGRVLLSAAQAMLLEPESKDVMTLGPRSTRSLTEHISKLSIALAPHKCLPTEILENIFCALHSSGSLELPPVLDHHPWVLGRVCSSWRRLSRSIPDFWKTEICLVLGSTNHSSLKQLRRAEILPSVAKIHLSVHEYYSMPLTWRALFPCLSYVHQLDYIPADRRLNHHVMADFPRTALSSLTCLRLNDWHFCSGKEAFNEETVPKSYAGLFGPTSQLEDLTLRSDTPALLFSDIPWSQLRSLCLEVKGSSSLSAWTEIGHQNPFRRMSSLRNLTLDIGDAHDYLSIILSFDFPWQQLTSFKVRQKIPCYDKLLKTLQKCISLIDFELTHHDYLPRLVNRTEFDSGVVLSSLETLKLPRVPFFIIRALVSAGNLLSVTINSVSLPDFYTVIKKCPRLTDLDSSIEGSKQSTDAGSVTSPQLTTLSIGISNESPFPTKLITPLLISLSIYCRSNLFETAAEFLIDSNIQLRKFVCIACSSHGGHCFPPSAQFLREVLLRLDYCSQVIIPWPQLPQDVLDEFASRSLLPCVDKLAIAVSSPDAFLTVIQRRLEREAESGLITLRDIRGYISDRIECLKSNLKELEVKYDVKCVAIWRVAW
ncbi:hypothetical protein H2248_011078 [Termitomyces sp. 'cryptogamus']|nr:hypothetical protein H2248_011078 [Termitomyces sp. 'cryptogamus']